MKGKRFQRQIPWILIIISFSSFLSLSASDGKKCLFWVQIWKVWIEIFVIYTHTMDHWKESLASGNSDLTFFNVWSQKSSFKVSTSMWGGKMFLCSWLHVSALPWFLHSWSSYCVTSKHFLLLRFEDERNVSTFSCHGTESFVSHFWWYKGHVWSIWQCYTFPLSLSAEFTKLVSKEVL